MMFLININVAFSRNHTYLFTAIAKLNAENKYVFIENMNKTKSC